MPPEDPDVHRRAVDRVVEVATTLATRAPELTVALTTALSDVIADVRDGPLILDLLRASVESNLEMLADTLRYDIPVEEVSPPAVALEYARRLAQRGISPNALVRSYRLGQQHVVDWAFTEITRHEPDPRVALIAGRRITATTFEFVDRITEAVLDEYDAELQRWMATRNTVRSVMLDDLLGGRRIDPTSAEASLGYRLGQQHLGVVLWTTEPGPSGTALRKLELALKSMSDAVGGDSSLFVAKDRSTAWGWIGLGRNADGVPSENVSPGGGLFAATGIPASGTRGFRNTHLEAERAQQVALVGKDVAIPSTSYANPEVRIAAWLTKDLDAARRMVQRALGPLAEDTESAGRLRDTLLAFLTAKGSYTATAELVHLHKNTVKYRIDKALEVRGRPIGDERLDLELALIACRWLGAAVITASSER